MKNKFWTYLLLQLKRAGKLAPHACVFTLLLIGCVALVGMMLSGLQQSDVSKQKVQIGVVGNLDNAYLRVGLYALENVDATRFSVELKPLTQPEARQELIRGQISAYIVIPDDFVESMYYGRRSPVTYVTTESATGISTLLMDEIANTLSTLLLETENAVYGVQELAEDTAVESMSPEDAGDLLSLRYMTTIFQRESLFHVETAGHSDSIAFSVYVGALVLFTLLCGISFSPLFSRRSKELGQLLHIDGLTSIRQFIAEFIAFTLPMLLLTVGASFAVLWLLRSAGQAIPELNGLLGEEIVLISLKMLPAALMIASLQFLLYELVPGSIGGILLQFLNAIVQGFLAGCLYPASFLPDGMRRLGEWLPAGVGVAHVRNCLLQLDSPALLGAVAGYTLLFLVVAAFIRKQRSRL